MFKRVISLLLALTMALAIVGCGEETAKEDDTSKDDTTATEQSKPQYVDKQFELSGFWAPYEITEESFTLYKEAGFTHFAMINHSLNKTSEEQFYLGSERTMEALKMCKKVGLKAILNYNDWIATWSEADEDYYGATPFSKFDVYGEYKDIITGIHIVDEPYKNRDHFEIYGNKTLVEDFKKVYPNARYIANLIPMTALSSRGFETYEEMMALYEEVFMEPFDNPYVSVDVYPFHQNNTQDDGTLLANYLYIANSAKKYGVKPAYILQSSIGGADEGRKEFEMALSESDLRWEVYNALLFGADTLQYYCYAVPMSLDENGDPVYMYDQCMLNRDGTPSDVYFSLQKIHKEIQSYSNVILSYDWETTIGKSGYEETTYRVAPLELDDDFNYITFNNAKNFVDVSCSHDLALSQFTSKDFGDAYMFLNWADREDTNTLTATFKDCSKIMVYGGAGFSGTPKTLDLNEKGEVTLELAYGEGVFIVPVA